MNKDIRKQTLEAQLKLSGVLTAKELAGHLKVSQPTLSRLIKNSGDKIVQLGRARSTRYALRREVEAGADSWPLYRVDEAGKVHWAGALTALYGGHFLVQSRAPLDVFLQRDFVEGLFPSLPWFLDDLRPQGFMGRAYARREGRALGLNPDPRLWPTDDVLRVLLKSGHDLPGDLIVGDIALEKFQQPEVPDPDGQLSREELFLKMAEAALKGDTPGSSAGGEQPKFVTTVTKDRVRCPVIVKFSPPVDQSPAAKRWSDLLIAEHKALRSLEALGFKVSESEIVFSGERTFLQCERFDRAGQRGRRALVSLGVLDAAYYGQADTPWTDCADRLERDGWLTAEDAESLRRIWWFGTLIGNTDMHYGNTGLCPGKGLPYRLAPVYDMLPMLYAPGAGGELTPRTFRPPPPPPQSLERWIPLAEAAVGFWEDLGQESQLSDEFRKIAAQNAVYLCELKSRFL